MRAIRVETTGGPDVLALRDVPLPELGPGQARVTIEAIGLNYIDTYQRTGLYPVPMPYTPGLEAAGVVTETAAGVTEVKPGDRVAYANRLGAYAEHAVVPADLLVRLPDGLDAKVAAAAMLQGMTAHFLVEDAFALREGQTCVVHAAAGGVGLLLVQMAKRKGARVLATVSTEAKAVLAREAGADVVVRYTEQDFVAAARALTGGRGVEVVYDSVGQATFDKSLAALRTRGTMVLFGQSSGVVPPFSPNVLAQKGSLFLTRPTLFHYIADRESLLRRAEEVLGLAASGRLKVRIGATFPLAEAAQAHRALEGRETTGKVLLLP
jgi:NADPH2:quinone reductase